MTTREDATALRRHVCIVGSGLLSALHGEYVGGAEKQCALLAQALSRRGHRVTSLDCLLEAGAREDLGGVAVRGIWPAGRGARGLRWLTHRMPSIRRSLARLRPDVVYLRATSLLAVCTALAARRRRIDVLWALASEYDLFAPPATEARNGEWYAWLNRDPMFRLYRNLLRRLATRVLCQTHTQLATCHDFGLGRKATLSRSLYTGPFADSATGNERRPVCLWVGKLGGAKGDAELIDIARRVPDCEFRVVGRTEPRFEGSDLCRQLAELPNVERVGYVPHDRLLPLYREASCLLCTSPSEGFSNVFLEAWAHETPVASLTVDPDALLEEHGLGICAHGDRHRCAEAVRRLCSAPDERRAIGQRAARYVRESHGEQACMTAWDPLLAPNP